MNIREGMTNILSWRYLKMKHYCSRCDQDVNIIKNNEVREFKMQESTISIEVESLFCKECNNRLMYKDDLQDSLLKARLEYEKINNYDLSFLKEVRKSLNLTQGQFAKILSIGEATIKRYELGKTVPNNAKLNLYKQLYENPLMSVTLFENVKNQLNADEEREIEEKLSATGLIKEYQFQDLNDLYHLSAERESVKFSPLKTIKLIQYFSRTGVLKTKLMKLLWYSDFLMYKRYNIALTGLTYTHRKFGPVPMEHEFLLGYISKEQFVCIDEEESAEGYIKMNVFSTEEIDNINEFFSKEEIEVIKEIENIFKNFTSTLISNYSHEEKGWKETNERETISYNYAQFLSIQ